MWLLARHQFFEAKSRFIWSLDLITQQGLPYDKFFFVLNESIARVDFRQKCHIVTLLSVYFHSIMGINVGELKGLESVQDSFFSLRNDQ